MCVSTFTYWLWLCYSVGGVGHYCVFSKLKALESELESLEEKDELKKLYNYWLNHDLKTLYCKDILTKDTIALYRL